MVVEGNGRKYNPGHGTYENLNVQIGMRRSLILVDHGFVKKMNVLQAQNKDRRLAPRVTLSRGGDMRTFKQTRCIGAGSLQPLRVKMMTDGRFEITPGFTQLLNYRSMNSGTAGSRCQ